MTKRWQIPSCWKKWETLPVFAGSAHHWDLYVAPDRVYGVRKYRRKSCYEGWENDGFVRAARPPPELIAKINAMRMML